MADLAKLVVRLELQSAQLLNELTKTNAKLQGFERRIKGFGSSVKVALAAFAGAVSFNKIITASAEAAKNFAQLENAVVNAGEAAGGRTARQFANVSEELQNVTTFSDDAIEGVQQLLLRFQSIRTDRFDEATKSVLDLSTALGTDAEAAAKLLGRALTDPEKGMAALAKAGVIFSEKQKKVIKDLVETGRTAEAQGLILDELAGKFGGAAEAARNNFSGALAGVKNAFDNLLEIDGGLPEATKQLNELSRILADPATRQSADTLFSAIVAGATKAATAIGMVVEGLRLAAGGEGSNELANIGIEIDRLLDLQNEYNAAINNRATNGFLGLSITAEEAAKKIGGVNDQIRELTKLQQEMFDNGGKRKPKPGPTGSGAELLPDIVVTDGLSESAEKARKALEAMGKALTESIQDPLERYNATLAENERLLAAGVITLETYARANATARAELNQISTGILEVNERFEELNPSIERTLLNFKKLNAESIEDAITPANDQSLKKLEESLKESSKKLSVFAEQASRNTQDIIADALTSGFDDGLDGMLKSFGQMLQQMAAQAIAADIAGAIFGEDGSGGGLLDKGMEWLKRLGGAGSGASSGAAASGSTGSNVGGWISTIASLFGSMDMGGRGAAGVPVAIGRGVQPELFVPDTAGEFYPKGTWGMGGGKTEINFAIAAPTGRVSLETQQQIAARTQQALAHAQRRNG
jgi:hypothetical protein